MMDLQKQLQSEAVKPYLYKKRIGIEKESQRVSLSGELAVTDHPSILGNRSFHPYIQTDFSETQTELITPVFEEEEEAIRFLDALQDVTLRSMNRTEMLWPLSMPPALPDDECKIKIAKLDNQNDVSYRRYLAKVYGKRKQMVSGIHYNFEFSKELIEALYREQTEIETMQELQTEVYLKVSRQYLRYRWLVTYLFGASPYAEPGYFTDKNIELEMPVRSIRNSHFGYTNRPEIQVSYESLETYIKGIEHLVDTGDLIEPKEFYSAVRLRGSNDLKQLKEKGIRYVELRNIDLDPFSPYGISEKTLESLHLFVLLMLWLPEEKKALLEREALGNQKNDQVALEHPLAKTELYAEGQWLLTEMKKMIETLGLSKNAQDLVVEMLYQLDHPEATLSGRFVTYQKEKKLTNHDLAVELGNEYWEKAHKKPYQLAGYRHMELSTQALMFDALQRGFELEVLDEADQFLKLTYQDHSEYVKNGNMTSRDNYIVPLLMENKVVTKKVLAEAGFSVPRGHEYLNQEAALVAYPEFEKKAFVVKPKSTNFGLGISIFRTGATFEIYKQAVNMAFAEDKQIIVEEFIDGTEYRFFTLNGQTKAVLLRVPANVTGDGQKTIRELVALKNKDSLRGENHRSPLERIQLGEAERQVLSEEGLTFESIPLKDQVIYLRENSNVSTGGDSVDVTDLMDDSYKRIAEAAVEELGAVVCGLDLIIPDLQKEATQDSSAYSMIEANFNPMMHMHIYPFSGKGYRLTQDILSLLFPEY